MKIGQFFLSVSGFALLSTTIMCRAFSAASPGTPVDQIASIATDTLKASQISVTPSVPTITPQPQYGSLTGKLSYPSEFIPPLRVVATNIQTNEVYFVDTAQNQGVYTIANLLPGTYHVMAYSYSLSQEQHPEDNLFTQLSAGYTQAVLCGLSVDCQDHSLIDVVIEPGQTITNIDPGDWYAPAGFFPPDPTQ